MSKRILGKVLKGVLFGVILGSAWLTEAGSFAQPPSATMSFAPGSIGEGTVSTLTISFTNPDPVTPASDLSVVNNLPAGLRIATPSNASTDCVNGILSAPDGEATISLSNGRIGTNGTCEVLLDVTGDTAGDYMNVSGDVTSSAGNGGPANATLSISATLPGFEMAFSPGVVPIGGTSTVTYSMTNKLPSTSLQNLFFRNVLPAGMVVATPPNVSTTCDTTFGPPLTAEAGGSEINFILFVMSGGASCTASVDVTTSIAGVIGNTTTPLSFDAPGNQESGKASAVLDVRVEPLNLSGFFSGDPVPPGATLSLDFAISNLNRDHGASAIRFDNNLDAALTGLVAVGLPMNDVCGSGSTLSGTGLIGLSGGSLPAGGTCTFSVQVEVPSAAAAGMYTNTSTAVMADVDGRPGIGNHATDSFEVNEAPSLSKRFLDDPLPAGQLTTMEFTIENVSASNAATDIGFVDDLNQFIPGTEVLDIPAEGFCGAGSRLDFFSSPDDSELIMTGGSLAPEASCTFGVTVDVPLGTPSNTYVNTTEPITATVAGSSVTGHPAAAGLTFIAAPSLRKWFSEPRVAPGGTVTLELELRYGENAPNQATEVSFDDDLQAMMPNLVATGLPMNDVCGPGSRLDGTSILTLTGGTLGPQEQCSMSVTLNVPGDAQTGQYLNTTSDVSATAAGLSVLSAAATADLEVTSVVLEKQFVEEPVFAGDVVTLRFTVTNSDPTDPASSMLFTDNLDDTLDGMAAVGLPVANVCGAGSRIEGTSSLIFTGGNVPGGGSCSFDVSVQVPPNAAASSYNNNTSGFSFDFAGETRLIEGAHDTLTISEPLSFAKAFDVDVVAPGETVSLEFTIGNAHSSQVADQLAFTDDLGAALEGLEAVGLPAADVCGEGSMLTGTDVLTLSGGALAAESSCTFSVELQVPNDVATGTSVRNVSTELSGMIDGFERKAPPAQDQLAVNLMTLSKSFDSSAEPGDSTTLSFVIENLNSTSAAQGVSFTDDLDAVLSGLVAAGTPIEDVCGAGSVLDGSSVLTLRGGNLEPGASCTFSVAVEVPSTAEPGDYVNITSVLSNAQGVVGDPGTATLTVNPRSDMDGGVDGGADGGTGGGSGGGCGCRTTTAGDTPVWLLAFALFALWRRRVI
jgi:MYXO-CTERM domain-containing protein